jgi:hypothetical protein
MFREVFFPSFDGLDPVACSHFRINMTISILQTFGGNPWRGESTRSKAGTHTEETYAYIHAWKKIKTHDPSV